MLDVPHPEETAVASAIGKAASPTVTEGSEAIEPVSPAAPVAMDELHPPEITEFGELQQIAHYIKHSRYRGVSDGKSYLVVHTTTHYLEV